MKKKIPQKRKSRSTVRTLADEALLDSSRTNGTHGLVRVKDGEG